MKELKILLGQKIKELRIKRGYSQQQLAEMVNIDQRNMSNIECGNTFPTKTLVQIAKALNVDLPELFDFDYLPQSEDEMKKYVKEKLNHLSFNDVQMIYRLVQIMQ